MLATYVINALIGSSSNGNGHGNENFKTAIVSFAVTARLRRATACFHVSCMEDVNAK